MGLLYYFNRSQPIGVVPLPPVVIMPPNEAVADLPVRPDDKELAKIYDWAMAVEDKLKSGNAEAEAYLSGGLDWKSLGDMTKDVRYYDLSADIYKRASVKYGDDLPVIWLNLGNVRNLAKEYDLAEEAYKSGIKKFPKESFLYLSLAEMYRYGAKKSKEEVMKIYEDALNAEPGPPKEEIIMAYAPYLRDIGADELALHYYIQLTKMFPDNVSLKEEVTALQSKLGK